MRKKKKTTNVVHIVIPRRSNKYKNLFFFSFFLCICIKTNMYKNNIHLAFEIRVTIPTTCDLLPFMHFILIYCINEALICPSSSPLTPAPNPMIYAMIFLPYFSISWNTHKRPFKWITNGEILVGQDKFKKFNLS